MIMFKKTALLKTFFVLLMLLLVFGVYSFILRGFFQQDEWFGYAQYILHRGENLWNLLNYFFTPSIGHFTPFTLIILYGLFSFGLNYQLFAIVSILLHLILVLLFFYLVQIIFKKYVLSLLGGLLFGLLASGYQGTAWVAADIGNHGAMITGMLSTIFLFKLINFQKIKYLYLSLIFIILSLFFREINIGFFLLFPVLIYLLLGKKAISFKYTKFFGLMAILYILLRGIMFLAPNTLHPSTVFEDQPMGIFFYNMITLPIKAVSQSIIPETEIRKISEFVTPILFNEITTGSKGSPEYQSFVVTKVMEWISILLSLVIISTTLLIGIKSRSEYNGKILIFGLLWIIINSFVFAFAPEKSQIVTVVDSRYLYFISVGTVILIVSFLKIIFQKKEKIGYFLLLVLITLNGFWLSNKLLIDSQQGKLRKNILDKIIANYPVLPRKVIFYTESDSSYYGLPETEKVMPFQSGFGQTLLVWYNESQLFPGEFYQNKFLWDISSQGYKEIDRRGFGYFRNFENMADTLENYNLPLSSVIAFRYDSKDNSFENMSQEVRGRIEGYLVNKKIVDRRSYSLASSTNNKDSYLANDGNIETFWDSKLPYANPQYLEVFLETKTKIAQIQIDSYNNKDQNKVGYRLSIEGENGNWGKVFYAKRYPPSKDGIVNLYFDPKYTKRVKIEQIGYHTFATWVIHELRIYEKIN